MAVQEPLPRQRDVAVDFATPMGLTVTNRDPGRPTFLDVVRAGTDGRRQVIEPGQTFDCLIAAGPATITFGYGLDCRFMDPAIGEDDTGADNLT